MPFLALQFWLIAVFIFALGAVVGSFLNVVISRLPGGDSIIFPASRCPKCTASIRWYDNIPIISFILLHRRCRNCHALIAWQYPAVEALMGFMAVALFTEFLLSFPFIIYFVFAAALLAVIFIDFSHQIIPDAITLPGIVLGFVFSFANPLVSWQDSGLGILFGGGSLYLVALGYFLLTRREGMGGGDIKFLGMLGAFLGWQSLPFVLFASSLFGTIIGIGAMVKQKKGGKTVIPYGPFLAMAALFFLFFRERIFFYMDLLFSRN